VFSASLTITPFVAGCSVAGVAGVSGFEGAEPAASPFVEASAFARFFLADLDSVCAGGLLVTAVAGMVGGGRLCDCSWCKGKREEEDPVARERGFG